MNPKFGSELFVQSRIAYMMQSAHQTKHLLRREKAIPGFETQRKSLLGTLKKEVTIIILNWSKLFPLQMIES